MEEEEEGRLEQGRARRGVQKKRVKNMPTRANSRSNSLSSSSSYWYYPSERQFTQTTRQMTKPERG
jgi:hypothetical protein